jgi:hypothetical protein
MSSTDWNNTPSYDWKESNSGNHVCIDYDDLVATVFKAKFGKVWQIIVNKKDGGYFVEHEYFEDHNEAIARTEAILDGAKCKLIKARS